MPRFARFAFGSLALLLALFVFTNPGCDTGPARECDERFECGPGLVCDFGSNQCVAPSDSVCAAAGAPCGGDTPFCDPRTAVCVECTIDKSTSQCPRNWLCDKNYCKPCTGDLDCLDSTGNETTLCRADGGCAAQDDVAYVSATGADSADCSFAAPCSLPKAISTTKTYLRLSGEFTLAAPLVINRAVQIYGERDASTTVTRSGAGSIFEVSGTGTVGIVNLGLTGATGNAITVTSGSPRLELYRADLFNNSGVGLSGGTATLQVIGSLIVGNGGGGISGAGVVRLENNYFVDNGGPTSNGGALNLASADASNVIRFNTFAGNQGSPRAVSCGGTAVKLTSNIFSGTAPQVTNCTTTYSLYSTAPATSGANDVTGAPAFGATTFTSRDRDLLDYYRIGATSAAIGKGESLADIIDDFYGVERGVGVARDIGAARYQP